MMGFLNEKKTFVCTIILMLIALMCMPYTVVLGTQPIPKENKMIEYITNNFNKTENSVFSITSFDYSLHNWKINENTTIIALELDDGSIHIEAISPTKTRIKISFTSIHYIQETNSGVMNLTLRDLLLKATLTVTIDTGNDTMTGKITVPTWEALYHLAFQGGFL